MSLLLNLFIRITADLFGGALFIKMYLNIDLYVAIGILLLLSALFTIGGGASAVIWTDFIQTVFMVLGALTLMVISFIQVNGIQVDMFFLSISKNIGISTIYRRKYR